MNPIVEQLADAQTNEKRKTWLLSCPLYHFVADYHDIVRILRSAGYLAGVDYVERERVGLMARRNTSGMLPETVIFNQHLARGDLIIFQRRAGGETP